MLSPNPICIKSVHDFMKEHNVPPIPNWIEPIEWGVRTRGGSYQGWVKGALNLPELATTHAIVEIEAYSNGLWSIIKKSGIQ